MCRHIPNTELAVKLMQEPRLRTILNGLELARDKFKEFSVAAIADKQQRLADGFTRQAEQTDEIITLISEAIG